MTTPTVFDDQPNHDEKLTIRDRISQWLNGEVKRKQTIGPYAFLALGVIAGFWFTARTSSSQSQSQVDASAKTSCLARVDSRDQLRGVFIALYSRLEVTFPEQPLIGDLQDDLDAQYPALDAASCQLHPFQPRPIGG